MNYSTFKDSFQNASSCGKNTKLIKTNRTKDVWEQLVKDFQAEGYNIDYDRSYTIPQICTNIRTALKSREEEDVLTFYPKTPVISQTDQDLLDDEDYEEDTDLITKLLLAKYITNTGDISTDFTDGSNSFKRFMLGKLLEDNDVEVKNCDLSNYFLTDAMTYLAKKNSASISIQGFASYNPLLIENLANNNDKLKVLYRNLNKEAFLKMYKINKKELQDNNGLDVEKKIYKYVTPHMIENHYTPHVVVYIASFDCPVKGKNNIKLSTYFSDQRVIPPRSSWKNPNDIEDFDTMLNNTISDKDARIGGLKTAPITVIVTEKAEDALPFGDWLNTKKYEWIKKNAITGIKEFGPIKDLDMNAMNDLKLILFQLYYTLEVFNRYGLKHNDLHDGNFWIEPGNPNHVYWYVIEDENGKLQIFKLPAKIVIKIYDFDRSVLNKNKINSFKNRFELINTSLDFMWIDRPAPTGIYTHNEKDPLTDTFKVTCALKTDLFYTEEDTDDIKTLPKFYQTKMASNKEYEECAQAEEWSGFLMDSPDSVGKFKEIKAFFDDIMEDNVYNLRDIGGSVKKKICDMGSFCFPQSKPGTPYMKSTLSIINNPFFNQFNKTKELLANPVDLSQGIQFVWVLPGIERKHLKEIFINISDINIPIRNYETTLNTP